MDGSDLMIRWTDPGRLISNGMEEARGIVCLALLIITISYPFLTSTHRDGKTTLPSGDARDLVSLCSVVGVGND